MAVIIYHTPFMNAIDDKHQGRRLIAPPAGKEKRVDIGYDTFIYSVYNALGVGPKNAVTRRELCARLRCGDRLLRQAIEDLRHDRVILTDDNGTGLHTHIQQRGEGAGRAVDRQAEETGEIHKTGAARCGGVCQMQPAGVRPDEHV